MRDICYHVAVTLDGFIARQDGSIDGFPYEGDHVDDYNRTLLDYDTVIMGRKTYEFGYDFGLTPGERAYPNMEHWIFSKTIDVTAGEGVTIVRENWLRIIDQLRAADGNAIYLCGGSLFAGWLLSEGRIDQLKLKVNPVVFGSGVPLFAGKQPDITNFELVNSKRYKSGVILSEYLRTNP